MSNAEGRKDLVCKPYPFEIHHSVFDIQPEFFTTKTPRHHR